MYKVPLFFYHTLLSFRQQREAPTASSEVHTLLFLSFKNAVPYIHKAEHLICSVLLHTKLFYRTKDEKRIYYNVYPKVNFQVPNSMLPSNPPDVRFPNKTFRQLFTAYFSSYYLTNFFGLKIETLIF